ncbi:high-potential iron-sulfur protein [Undibacterium sp. TJN25]|uniref:high-potential iron-sulfur protein n=1 Tax=Undibacterium sp. TJN25 TaxID=3413056 RepID=UPI003BF0B8F0
MSSVSNLRRRTFVIRSLAGAAALAGCGLARAEDPKLQEADPLALEHGYKMDPSTVDKTKYPTYQKGQICGTCQLFEERSKEWGACALFPGKQVHVNAWCDAWG